MNDAVGDGRQNSNESVSSNIVRQTGMLPDGWEWTTLRALAHVARGKFSARPRNDPKYFGGDMPFVQTGDVAAAGLYLRDFSQTLNEQGLSVSKVFPKETILLTIAANIGATAMTTFPVACPDSVVAIQPYPDQADTIWFKYALADKRSILEGQAGQNAQKNINLQTLEPLALATPPLSEQHAIGRILKCWDAAIETLEHLLVNSREQKTALMNRFFSKCDFPITAAGEWRNVALADVAYIDAKSINKATPDDFEFRYITLSDVSEHHVSQSLATYRLSDAPSRARRVVRPGDLLMSTVRPNLQGFARVTRAHVDCIASTGFAVLTVKPGTSPDYLFHYLFSTHIQDQINAIVTGSSYPSINSSDVERLWVRCPPLEAQQAIATILDTADERIRAEAQQREILIRQKHALMQQLLTGKRRVPVDPRDMAAA